MLIGIDENDDHGQLASCFDQMRSLHAVTAQKSGYSVKGSGGINVFLAQVVENLEMQRPVMPLVGFVQIDCDLNCHCVLHCTWNRFAAKLSLPPAALPL